MLAPRIARWVEARGRLGENAVNEAAAFSPSLPLTSTLRRPWPACQHASLLQCRLRELRASVLSPSSRRCRPASLPGRDTSGHRAAGRATFVTRMTCRPTRTARRARSALSPLESEPVRLEIAPTSHGTVAAPSEPSAIIGCASFGGTSRDERRHRHRKRRRHAEAAGHRNDQDRRQTRDTRSRSRSRCRRARARRIPPRSRTAAPSDRDQAAAGGQPAPECRRRGLPAHGRRANGEPSRVLGDPPAERRFHARVESDAQAEDRQPSPPGCRARSWRCGGERGREIAPRPSRGHSQEQRGCKQQRGAHARRWAEPRHDDRPRGGADAPAEIERPERRGRPVRREARDDQVGCRHDETESDAGHRDRQRAGHAFAEREAGQAGRHQCIPRGSVAVAPSRATISPDRPPATMLPVNWMREERACRGVGQMPSRGQPRQHRAENRRDESGDDEAGEEQRPAARCESRSLIGGCETNAVVPADEVADHGNQCARRITDYCPIGHVPNGLTLLLTFDPSLRDAEGMSIRKRTDGEYSAHLQGTLDLLILRTYLRPAARAGNRPRHPGAVRQRAHRRARVALPGAAAARGTRLHRRRLGHVREQPQGAVLHADAHGPQGACARAGRLAAGRRRDHARPRTGIRDRLIRARARGPGPERRQRRVDRLRRGGASARRRIRKGVSTRIP